MKPGKNKVHETLMIPSEAENTQLLAAYNILFTHLLDAKNLSLTGLFEVHDLISSRFRRKPRVIERLLQQERLPDLMFLHCAN